MESIFEQWDFFDDPYSDFDHLLPKEQDFIRVCDAYKDVKANGEDCKFRNTAESIARVSTAIDIVRRIAVAIIIHWDELVNVLKDRWINNLKHSIEDLKKAINIIIANIDDINNLIDEYAKNLA